MKNLNLIATTLILAFTIPAFADGLDMEFKKEFKIENGENTCKGDDSTAMIADVSLLTGSHRDYCSCYYEVPMSELDPESQLFYAGNRNFPRPLYTTVENYTQKECSNRPNCSWGKIVHQGLAGTDGSSDVQFPGPSSMSSEDIKRYLDDAMKEFQNRARAECASKICDTENECCKAVFGDIVYSTINVTYEFGGSTYNATEHLAQQKANCGCTAQ